MKDDAQLLSELARLVERFGPERFSRLADLLRDSEAARQLATVVEAALVIRRPRVSRKGNATRVPLGSRILGELRESEPEKYLLLTSFRDDFVARTILTSMRQVHDFADQNDVRLGTASSRDKALNPLLRAIAALPLSAAETLVKETARDQSADRSLESWSQLIMGRGSKPPVS